MSKDPRSFPVTASSLGTKGRIVTPGNEDLEPAVKGVVTCTAGDITVIPRANHDSKEIEFVGVPAGWIPPYQVRRVTAATAIVATIED